MVFRTIAYYNFYIFLTPYLIFWLVFVYSYIYIITLYFTTKYKIFYYPNSTNGILSNFFIVLPKRMAFDIIYFWEKKKISKENFLIILNAIALVTFIGIPYIGIKILYFWYKKKNIWEVWEKISPYKNIKIIIIKKKIIKNMKKILTTQAKELISKVEAKATMGLYEIDQGFHAVGVNTTSGLGFTQSSKKLSEQDLKLSIKKEKNDYVYTQQWKNPIKLTKSFNEMKNPVLKKKLEDDSAYFLIESHKKISKTNEEFIKINDGTKQKWIPLDNITKSKAKKEIELLGQKNIDKFTEEYNIFKFYETTTQNAEKMIFDLSNADKQKYPEIRLKYEKDYLNLLYLKEKYNFSYNAVEKIEILLEKINKFIQ